MSEGLSEPAARPLDAAPPDPGFTPVGSWRRALGLREAGVYYALVLLVVALTVASALAGRPSYLNPVNLSNILYQASLVATLAVAMTVVLITGNFDLSVGSVAALSAAVALGLVDRYGLGVALLGGLAAGAAVGLLNGLIVELLGINAFIVTLGTLTAVRGLVLIVTDGRTVTVESAPALVALSTFEGGRWGAQPLLLAVGLAALAFGMVRLVRAWQARRLSPGGALGAALGGAVLLLVAWAGGPGLSFAKPVFYMAAFTLVVWFTLSYTVLGRRLYAVGGNPEAARLSGINVTRYKIGALVLSGLTAGFGGVLFGARLGAINPTGLQGIELTVIASAILGGTSLLGGAGSVLKSVVGALLLFTLTNGFNVLNLGANYQGLIEGTVVIVAAAIYTVGGRQSGRSRARALPRAGAGNVR